MAGILFVIIGLASFGVGFFLFYKLYLEKIIDRRETIDLLRKNGIGDRPENLTKRYYKSQNENLDEREVRKRTNQFMRNNKEFFLRMYEVGRQKDFQTKPEEKKDE